MSSKLVSFHSFFFSLSLGGFNTDFFVILFQGSQVFSGFGEFSFLHTFSDVPMHEGSLGVHKIELVINSWEYFSNGSWVGDHAHSSHDFGKITSWYYSGWLIVDTTFEASWAPIDELDSSLGLDGGNSSIHILGDDVSSVHKTASHVFTMSWIAFSHHGCRFEGRVGDFSNWQLFVVCLFSWDNWGIRWKHEMDSRIWDQVGLEFSNVHIQGSVKSEGSSKRWNNLGDQSVKIGVGRSFNI